VDQCSHKHTPEAKHRRAINPYQEISPGDTVVPGGGMTSFEYPLIASLDLATQPCLLIDGSLDPAGLPMDSVDVYYRQTCAITHLPSQPTFSRARLADDHDTLH
jgi:hypothetical protein